MDEAFQNRLIEQILEHSHLDLDQAVFDLKVLIARLELLKAQKSEEYVKQIFEKMNQGGVLG